MRITPLYISAAMVYLFKAFTGAIPEGCSWSPGRVNQSSWMTCVRNCPISVAASTNCRSTDAGAVPPYDTLAATTAAD